ncbi:MAG: glycosylase [Nocardioides sp.]|nr:glycosylase [Nocardioides sp.]
MPEGDTVFRTARLLDRSLSGRVLSRTDFRVPQLATSDLSGGTVVETVSRGKHLLTRVDGPTGSGERWTLHTHLKMEGAWRVHEPGQRWTRPAHQARVVLETDAAVAVGFSLGVVELLPRDDEDRAVGHLGPDLLGPDWDEHEALRRLHEDPDLPVGVALLDQRRLAGIGTLYRAETLFLTGVNPYLAVHEVPDLRKVVDLARRLLLANTERAAQITTGNLRRGEQHWVFERSGRPCRRCGTRISSGTQGPPGRERLSYWCPACQPSL